MKNNIPVLLLFVYNTNSLVFTLPPSHHMALARSHGQLLETSPQRSQFCKSWYPIQPYSYGCLSDPSFYHLFPILIQPNASQENMLRSRPARRVTPETSESGNGRYCAFSRSMGMKSLFMTSTHSLISFASFFNYYFIFWTYVEKWYFFIVFK